MALTETESLVLKRYDLADADKIVVFLTHDHGVVRGVAKGAKRLKSRFGSGLEPFSTVRLTYFQKESQELVSIQSVEMVRSCFAAASDPEFLAKFSYLADLLVAFSPPHDPNATLYRMVKVCLDTAQNDPATLVPIGVYFELWLLRLAGFLPDWTSCLRCKRAFDEAEPTNLQPNFELLCSTCGGSGGSTALPPVHRAIYAAARRQAPAEFCERFATEASELGRLSIILKRIISQAVGYQVSGEIDLATAATI